MAERRSGLVRPKEKGRFRGETSLCTVTLRAESGYGASSQ